MPRNRTASDSRQPVILQDSDCFTINTTEFQEINLAALKRK
jgi:hypothetical protein